jgi:hypothetical protein
MKADVLLTRQSAKAPFSIRSAKFRYRNRHRFEADHRTPQRTGEENMVKTTAWIGALLCALLGCRLAFAYDDVSGVIQKIDIPSRQLVLDGERTYAVARGIDLGKLKPGDKVTVHTEDLGGKKDLVTKIKKGDYFPPALLKQNSRGRSIP